MTKVWLHQNELNKLSDISENFEYSAGASNFSTNERYGYSKGQGVAILWKRDLPSITPLLQVHHDRICGIRLQMGNNSVINISCIYLPARGNEEIIEVVIDELSAIIENSKLGTHNILCGDFNADLRVSGGPRSAKIPDKRGVTLANFTMIYNMIQTNLTFNAKVPINTHYGLTGETCIDYVMVPEYIVPNITECAVLRTVV